MGKRKGGSGNPRPSDGRELVAQGLCRPRKRFYRARAHANPLNDASIDAPVHPGAMDWTKHFPALLQAPDSRPFSDDQVRFADVGCGFGGLVIKLAEMYQDTLMVGMELRDKVTEYVKERIGHLRKEHPGRYQNVSVLRANAQRQLVNYFRKGQLTKMFFLFPDPHFKAANHRRRIINTQLITEYSFLLAPDGILYTITDVPELGDWMREKLDAHPLFERLSDAELAADPAAGVLDSATEEGQKVARNGGQTFRSVYRRVLGETERQLQGQAR